MARDFRMLSHCECLYACFQIAELNAEIKDKVEKQQKFEEERKEQIALIKKVNKLNFSCHLSKIIDF